MDFIIMLVIFGVISSLTKKSKKPQPGQRRIPPANTPVSGMPANRATLQTRLNEIKKPETMQGGLTSLFNMLAGEEVLKDPRDAERARTNKLQAEEERLFREQRELEYQIKSDQDRNLWESENKDINEIGDAAEYIEAADSEAMNLQGSSVSDAYNLSELQKGIIWREILEKPKALRNTRNN